MVKFLQDCPFIQTIASPPEGEDDEGHHEGEEDDQDPEEESHTHQTGASLLLLPHRRHLHNIHIYRGRELHPPDRSQPAPPPRIGDICTISAHIANISLFLEYLQSLRNFP